MPSVNAPRPHGITGNYGGVGGEDFFTRTCGFMKFDIFMDYLRWETHSFFVYDSGKEVGG